jgi:hypothetical protein
MRSKLGKLSVLTMLISAVGLMAAFASSASADSITCKVSGAIKLSPGLTETPQVQNIQITKKKGALLSECSGTETTVTGGNINIHMRTTEAVSCSALTGPGAPVTPENAIFKWQPKGGENSMGLINIPLTEMPVAITGSVNAEPLTAPFAGDTVTGEVTQKYGATCGSSGGHGHGGGGKKDNKGTFTGTITIS